MVTFSEHGLEKLKEVLNGTKAIVISSDTPEEFVEHSDELSVVTEKLAILSGGTFNQVAMGNSTAMVLGNPNLEDGYATDVKTLFDFFGITYHELTDAMHVKSANGFFYDTISGEPCVYNQIIDRFITNDGSMLPKQADKSYMFALGLKYMKAVMPDYILRIDNAKETANTSIEVGSKVRIKTYAQLKEQFGEAFLSVNSDTGRPESKDTVTGEEQHRFIKTIVFQHIASEVYCGKEAIVEAIDYPTGRVILNIDGNTKHNSFMVNGREVKQPAVSIDFFLSMLEII